MAQMQWLGTIPAQKHPLADVMGRLVGGYMGGKERKREREFGEKELKLRERALRPYEQQIELQQDQAIIDSYQKELSALVKEMEMIMDPAEKQRRVVSMMDKWIPILDTTFLGERIQQQTGKSLTDNWLESKGEPEPPPPPGASAAEAVPQDRIIAAAERLPDDMSEQEKIDTLTRNLPAAMSESERRKEAERAVRTVVSPHFGRGRGVSEAMGRWMELGEQPFREAAGEEVPPRTLPQEIGAATAFPFQLGKHMFRGGVVDPFRFWKDPSRRGQVIDPMREFLTGLTAPRR